MIHNELSANNACAIPHHISTQDFEHYVSGTSILSSRDLGWESVTVREYHEPTEVEEEMFMPTAPDVFLALTLSGVVKVEIRSLDGPWVSYIMRTGDLCLTPGNGVPYMLRRKSLSPEPIRVLYVHLNQHLFAQAVEELVDRDPARLIVQNRSGFQDPLLSQLGLALQREIYQPVAASKLYADTTAEMMSVHLIRHYATQHVALPEYTQELSQQQMRLVTDFILAHLQDSLSLDMLAQQVGLSRYHFARLFRRTTGESPHQFVLHKRLEAAQHLLRKTDLHLSQIAVGVGFSNQGHFTQTFKRHLGLTPLRYRQHQ